MDTIGAIATPAGAGGVGIVRVSGEKAVDVFKRFFHTEETEIKERYAYFGAVTEGSGKVLDRGIALFFRAPKSYTGEDVVEFQVHGAPVVLKTLLESILASGWVRLAEPGEFTRRAFLNGKITLTDTERLNLLLSAETELQLRVARELEKGRMGPRLREIRRKLIQVASRIEAAIEYPEEDEVSGVPVSSGDEIRCVLGDLKTLSASYKRVSGWAHGVRVVLAGPPNSGKSSLLNAIVGYQRAIVTAVPGTTRDTVEVITDIDGLRCTIVDTAGFRKPSDELEAEGIYRAKNEIEQADIVLFLMDPEGNHKEKGSEVPVNDNCFFLSVLSKADLVDRIPEGVLGVSAKTGQGIGILLRRIRDLFDDVDLESAFLFTERQKLAVDAAVEELETSLSLLADDSALEIAAAHLSIARWHLESVIGLVTTDEMLDGIFSNFCLGK